MYDSTAYSSFRKSFSFISNPMNDDDDDDDDNDYNSNNSYTHTNSIGGILIVDYVP